MTRLVLINGAPGSGKSTLAHSLAQDRAMTLALDIDWLKHCLGRWEDDPSASGLHARRLTLALASEHLQAGFDVVVGQYLARPAFIEELERLAGLVGAQFFEIVLEVDPPTLARRLAQRIDKPGRPEHEVNNRLVRPDQAVSLVQSLESLRPLRPCASWVDAAGSLSATLAHVRAVLHAPTP